MYTTLLLALLATTALSTPLTPHPSPSTTNTTTLHRRDAEEGTQTGLTISIWSVAHCKGAPDLLNAPILLENGIAQQTVSYALSDDIGVDMEMGFFVDTAWTATGDDSVDASEDGDGNSACAAFAYNADEAHSKTGCQTLPKAVGCVFVSNT